MSICSRVSILQGVKFSIFPIGTDVAVITVLLYRAACDYNMKRHQLMNERYRIALSKNVAAIAVSKFVRRDLFWWQQIVETM